MFPAGQRAVIVLLDIEGAGSGEACALLSLSPENHGLLLHRARNRVRRTIDTLLDGQAERADDVCDSSGPVA